MLIPDPLPGLVIRYAYLWLEEHRAGRDEGVKDRPCAVVLVTRDEADKTVVTVLAITHSPPTDPTMAMEIPEAIKQRLGLDHERSWIVLNEANRFIWPGPDLRPNRADSIVYGPLPNAFFVKVRDAFVAILRARRARAVARTPWALTTSDARAA